MCAVIMVIRSVQASFWDNMSSKPYSFTDVLMRTVPWAGNGFPFCEQCACEFKNLQAFTKLSTAVG